MAWTTNSELKWIDNIGHHGPSGQVPGKRNRKKCLLGYIEAAEKRDYWGQIDKEIAIEHAKALLDAEY